MFILHNIVIIFIMILIKFKLWNTIKLDPVLFAQKRFSRIVSLKLLKRLLRLVEPIRELEMLFAVVFERDLQVLAIPIQLQAFEKLWTNLDEGTTERTRKKLAHVGFTTLELVFSGAIEHLLTETHQALEETFTVVFEILMKLRERVPVLDGDVVVCEIEIGQSRRFPEGAGGGKNFFCVSRNGGIATSFASQEPGEKRYPGRFAPPWRGRIFPLTNPRPPAMIIWGWIIWGWNQSRARHAPREWSERGPTQQE